MNLLGHWKEEKRSAVLYRELAKMGKGSTQESLFLSLAEKAEEQAQAWEASLKKEGLAVPTYVPDLRVRVALLILNRFGPRSIRSFLFALKVRGLSVLTGPQHAMTHSLPHPKHQNAQDIGKHHRTSGGANNLRAGIFGINDGLVSNASLILGIAGAAADPKMIVLTGSAGLLAGALSMAAGEYVSVLSQREMLEHQVELEKEELEKYPEDEAAELALIYEAKGFPKEHAEAFANNLVKDHAVALNTLVKEEMGFDPHDLGSPWGAALSSFFCFSLGGFLPLLPYLIPSSSQLRLSLAITGSALFLTGALTGFFSGKNAVFSGLRMVLIGGGAGLVTYLIGSLFQVPL